MPRAPVLGKFPDPRLGVEEKESGRAPIIKLPNNRIVQTIEGKKMETAGSRRRKSEIGVRGREAQFKGDSVICSRTASAPSFIEQQLYRYQLLFSFCMPYLSEGNCANIFVFYPRHSRGIPWRESLSSEKG